MYVWITSRGSTSTRGQILFIFNNFQWFKKKSKSGFYSFSLKNCASRHCQCMYLVSSHPTFALCSVSISFQLNKRVNLDHFWNNVRSVLNLYGPKPFLLPFYISSKPQFDIWFNLIIHEWDHKPLLNSKFPHSKSLWHKFQLKSIKGWWDTNSRLSSN
jgi:hypothetical protein